MRKTTLFRRRLESVISDSRAPATRPMEHTDTHTARSRRWFGRGLFVATPLVWVAIWFAGIWLWVTLGAISHHNRFASGTQPALKEIRMKKTLTAVVAAAGVAAATAVSPTPADAHCYGCGVGAGLLGGFVAGAIVGSALARPYPYAYYAPAPVYYDYPAPVYYGYYGPRPYYGCWGWRHGYRYRVC